MRWVLAVLAVAAVVVGCSTAPIVVRQDDLSPQDVSYTKRAQDVVRRFVAGDFHTVRGSFDDVMLAGLSETKMRESWAKFTALHGPLLRQTKPQIFHTSSGTTVNIRLAMLNGPAQARVTFDPTGKISGLWLLRADVPVPH